MTPTDTFTLISAYNNDLSWIDAYFSNYIIYNQGGPIAHKCVVKRPHLGADLLDKFSWIVENYDHLPDVVMFIKGNLFKFISEPEFQAVYQNKTFTPLLTQKHPVKMPMCYYKNGMYYELNAPWYETLSPKKFFKTYNEFAIKMGLPHPRYIPFAPGSNYIVPKENLLKRSRDFYRQLMTYINYTTYSFETHMCERTLYSMWF